MPNPGESQISIRAPWTPVYGRAQANTAKIEMELAGAAVTPSAVTYTLLGPTGSTVTTGAASTLGSGTATYALTSVHLPSTAALSAGYLERWVITWASGDPITYERLVMVGRRTLAPPVGQTDLEQRWRNLTRQRTGTLTDYQDALSQAWADVLGELQTAQVLPQRIIQPASLRAPMLHRALAIIFENMAAGQAERGNWMDLADREYTRYAQAMTRAIASVDRDDDGIPDAEGTAKTALVQGVIFNGAPETFITPDMARASGW